MNRFASTPHRFTTRLLATCLLTWACTAAWAQGTITVFKPRADGQGVEQYAGDLTREEAEVLIDGGPMPDNATGVIIEAGKPARWTSETGEELNRRRGGTGKPDIVLFDKEGKGGRPEPVKDLPEGRAPEPVFPNETGDQGKGNSKRAIRPLSGTWGMSAAKTKDTGCPPELVANASDLIAGSVGTVSRELKMSNPFHPSAIWDGLNWKQTATNTWQATVEPAAAAGQASPFKFSVTIKATVIAPDEIASQQTIAIKMPPILDCTVNTSTTLTHSG